MKIYDISQEVFGCQVYAGDPVPGKKQLCSMEKGDLYNLTAFSMCAHNGTHIDAPFHFIKGGKTVDSIGLDTFIGMAYVAEYHGIVSDSAAAEILEKAKKQNPEAAKRILIKGDLLMQEPQSEKSERYLAVIRERTDAMRGLTEELFRYSVIAGTIEELHLEPVCLNDILEQSLVGFYGALTGRGITPEIQMPEQEVVRELDVAAIRRILDNLLSNAVKYSDGDLCVSLTDKGEIIFSNHAVGLDSVQVKRLFDRFYTVETARQSSGLGLSIAKLLTEHMGGSITATYHNGNLSVSVIFP